MMLSLFSSCLAIFALEHAFRFLSVECPQSIALLTVEVLLFLREHLVLSAASSVLGISPNLFCNLSSAPSLIKYLAICLWPYLYAKCSGVS